MGQEIRVARVKHGGDLCRRDPVEVFRGCVEGAVSFPAGARERVEEWGGVARGAEGLE